jgi:acetylornithine deacetylase/succinyl-diaminopimelate desuccinylase-like protein
MIANAWDRIDAEFAMNEGGYAMDTPIGTRLFQVQTAEKVPTRITLIARGTAGHGSMPRPDNAVVHLARAIARLADATQPMRLNATTRRYFREMAKIPDYAWLKPLLPKIEAGSASAANQLEAREPEFGAMLRTTVSPTMLEAGVKINVIPNEATAHIDVRRLPNESSEEVIGRFRRIIGNSAVEVRPAGGQEMPPTEPSSLTTPLYLAMEKILRASHERAVVVPYMIRGATDGAFLRQKGMAVYGVPVFVRVDRDSRAHGNDERISLASFDSGVRLLWEMVTDLR